MAPWRSVPNIDSVTLTLNEQVLRLRGLHPQRALA